MTEALIDTGRRIITLGQLHYDTDRLTRIDEDNGQSWDIFNQVKLMGHFDLEVALKPRLILEPREEADMALVVHERRAMSDLDLLKFLRIPDPEGVLQRAREELMQKMQLEMAMQQGQQGQQGGTPPQG